MEKYMENHQNKVILRQEKKYLFKTQDVISFEKTIVKRGFKLNHLPNIVNNIYFEDIKLSSAIENVEGDEMRSKHRIRWYNDNLSKIILERKIKFSSSGTKEKIILKSKDYITAINEAEGLTNKKAIIQNSYFRKYYLKENIRITIDTNLKFKLPKTSNFKIFNGVIVEIKYNTKDDFNVSTLINNYSQLGKFSKYLEGLKKFDRI
jgi:hypothetical protein